MLPTSVDADQLAAVLDQQTPEYVIDGPRASVAATLRQGSDGPELLFIQRAAKNGDPWSGQMAFPGGRAEAHDADSFATAERETQEEVGLDLSPARRLGSLSELDGGRATNRLVAVQAHCYWLDGPAPQLSANYEVADTLWVPLRVLADRDRYIEYHYPVSDSHFPGIQLDKDTQVIWGLTLRFLSDLFGRLGIPFII